MNADSQKIWMDGKLIPYADALVPVLSHSLHYGTAVFEGIRAYETSRGESAIFRAEEHFRRFSDSMRTLGYASKFSEADFIQASCAVIKANDFKSCYVRPLAYIDDSTRGLKLPKDAQARVAIAAWTWGKYMGDEGAQKGIRIMTSTFRRPDISTAMSWSKLSGSYLTSVLARREATLHGFDEAVLLDPQGFIAEGSGENIFMVKNRTLHTPNTGYILPGITRASVIEIARSLGFTVQECNITRNQLYLADEAFFSGTAVEVTGIHEIDGHVIGKGGVGPITRQISDVFFKAVRGDAPEFKRWLTIV